MESTFEAVKMGMTGGIVSSYLSNPNNPISAGSVPEFIRSVYACVSTLGTAAATVEPPKKPAVTIRASIQPDYIVCLEDGKRLKMLRRYLRSRYNLTPEQYRAKWGLPAEYPMTCPKYAAKRSALAKKNGLGKR